MSTALQVITETAAQVGTTLGQFVYDFQTLITGLLAIGAAYYGATPVWRQMRDSNLQARIMHRQALATRLREAQDRAARVAKEIDQPLSQLMDLTTDPDDSVRPIGEHDAHAMEMMLHGLLDWYLVTLAETEDAPVEAAKNALKTALDSLTATLRDVHWPAHNDQSGEDYALSDEEWAEVLKRANDGQTLAAEKVSAARKANNALKVAQAAWATGLRQQIARLDLGIAKNG